MDPRIEEAQELVISLKTKCQLKKEKTMRKERESTGNVSPKGNNNDENFVNNYDTAVDHRSSSGRLSSNSASNNSNDESAFSSASEGEDSETNCEDRSFSSASSSGRSSANRSSSGRAQRLDSLAKQLNTYCNLVPDSQRARDLIEQARRKFVDNLQPADRNLFEEADLFVLENDPDLTEVDPRTGANKEQALSFRLVSRFINFKQLSELVDSPDRTNDALDKALDDVASKLRELLQFRHQYKLTHVLDEHFSKEIHMLHGIFPFGYDKNNLPVLYLRARVHRRWSRELDDSFRRYVAWQVDLLTKSYSGAKVNPTAGFNAVEKDGSFGICFDCLNVSYSCVDMDFLSFLVKILVNYYPTYCRYALCVDLPWLFRSVWKIVRSWLPEDARNTVHLITTKQLTEFINEDQIPNSMRVNDLVASEKPESLRHRKPKNFDSLKTVDQFAKDLNLSSSELKQFKVHVDKVCKEYEQLGAI